ncbi:MAG: hypothetical protein JNK50_01175 [Bacteroidia bacterium]|nr:hypothetical protein [Bacteroidia bacterium]
MSSIQWIESDIKQTEIILNQDSQSENSEEKSEFELEETLLNSNNLEHTIKLCYSEIYFSQQNVLLIDGLSGHTTPPPKVC